MSAAAESFSYLCIGCPLGCRLEVDVVDGDVVEVRGNSCTKGTSFGRQEYNDPRRLVTTTVALDSERLSRLPVKTTIEVPRGQVVAVCEALRCVRVRAPVQAGDVIVGDVLGTGADVVATRSVRA